MRRGGGITRTGLFRFSSWSLTPVQTRNCTLTLMSCIRDISDVYIDKDVTEENITFKYPHYFFLKDALLIELMSE